MNKCPNCGGEFEEWHTNENDIDKPLGKDQCPWCGLIKLEYGDKSTKGDSVSDM